MKISYKKTKYNNDIAEYLEDDVRRAWEEGHAYTCIEFFLDESAGDVADIISDDITMADGSSSVAVANPNRLGFIMFEMGVVRKMAILVHEYVDADYRDQGIGTEILEDSCSKLLELGYNGIYASIKGYDEDIESKRYFLDSQGFSCSTNIQIPTYLRRDIINSEWYKSFADSEALKRAVVSVSRDTTDHEIIHRLSKDGIFLAPDVLIKTITQDEKMYGAVLYGIENNAVIIYDVHIFEKTMEKKLFCALVVSVLIDLNQMDDTIRLVKICANDSFEMELLSKNLGEPYDLEVREEWLLRLAE